MCFDKCGVLSYSLWAYTAICPQYVRTILIRSHTSLFVEYYQPPRHISGPDIVRTFLTTSHTALVVGLGSITRVLLIRAGGDQEAPYMVWLQGKRRSPPWRPAGLRRLRCETLTYIPLLVLIWIQCTCITVQCSIVQYRDVQYEYTVQCTVTMETWETIVPVVWPADLGGPENQQYLLSVYLNKAHYSILGVLQCRQTGFVKR